MLQARSEDTIFALATPPGRSGVAVLRISGNSALAAVRRLAAFLPIDLESHKVYYGHLKTLDKSRVLDEVLVTAFLGSRSFTGEESVEISCHGNPVIVDEVLRELGKTEARHAEPGEFTFRAFMNNRIDLVQAEAVLSVIESQSPFEKENALKQLGGGISDNVAKVRSRILHLMAHIEADIDFSTEGLETIDRGSLIRGLTESKSDLENLIAGYNRGRLLQSGFKAVFAGSPNVGKSSLLNAVLGEERSIVTAKPGTTRDLIEAWSEVAGVRVSWTDTAGLRATEDEIEEIGIQRVERALKEADLIFWVLDPHAELSATAQAGLERILSSEPEKLVLVVNKMDLLGPDFKASSQPGLPSVIAEILSELKPELAQNLQTSLFVSALWKEETQKRILNTISDYIQSQGAAQDVVISRARHFEALSEAKTLIDESMLAVESGLGGEIIALSLKEALVRVQSVLGERYDEQIIDQIFKEFCLGK